MMKTRIRVREEKRRSAIKKLNAVLDEINATPNGDVARTGGPGTFPQIEGFVDISPVRLPFIGVEGAFDMIDCEDGASVFLDWRPELNDALPDEGDRFDHLTYLGELVGEPLGEPTATNKCAPTSGKNMSSR